MSIGSKLQKLIADKQTNANELAARAKVPASTLYSIIKRDNTKADIDVLINIAKVLGVPVEYFSDEFNPDEGTILTKAETSLLSDYRLLNPSGQKIVDSTAKGLTNNPQYSLPPITVTHTEEPRDIFSDPTVAMAASGLTATSELSDHNKDVILKAYNKMKKGKKD